MTSVQAVLVSVIVLGGAIPVARWGFARLRQAFERHDARLDDADRAVVRASVPVDTPDADPLAAIEMLLAEELELIRAILDERVASGHVSEERVIALRHAHRRGLIARQGCGDRALDAEVGWLQGYGSYAVMADLSAFDRAVFERDLAFRADELRQAVELRRLQTHSR